MKIPNFLKLNQQRKVFLFVWSIIAILVTLAMFGNIGQHVEGKYYDFEDEKLKMMDKDITFDEIKPFFIILAVATTFLYIIVGLEEIETYDSKSRRKKA